MKNIKILNTVYVFNANKEPIAILKEFSQGILKLTDQWHVDNPEKLKLYMQNNGYVIV